MIYLDHNSTTPVDQRVLEEMLPFFTEQYGNAASIDHDPGHYAQAAVEKARNQIASLIGAKSEEIIFTSGATESDNLAILGVAEKYRDKGNHIITAKTEHKAVLDSCKHLEKNGFEITYLPVDSDGRIDVQDFENACTNKTILASIMYANNEIGTIAPIREIGAITRARGIVFHSDATQAVGHIPINVDTDNIDLMSMSAHKMYGPKGVGALFTRRRSPRVKVAPLIHGGGHEKGLRSGTLNVPGIVGFGKAAEICAHNMRAESERYLAFSTVLLRILRAELGEILLNGHPQLRLPNNLNISLPRVESKSLIVQFKDIAVSTGSACTSASVEPSHVIMALGYGEDRAHSAIRIGWGRKNTPADVEHAAGVIIESVQRIRKLNINI
jgi:cysteine desulfurase